MKAWSALRHRLGEATDLPELIEKARSDDAEVRRHARFGLAERLVGRGKWPSAAGRAVSELVVDAVYPDTPNPAELLELLCRIAGADANRVLLKPLEPQERPGEEVLEALDARSPELQDMASHDDPAVRAQAIRLIAVAVPDAELPESEDDPDVEATLAIARARRGLPDRSKTPNAAALHASWEHRDVDEDGLATALGWTPDPAKFPWADGDIDAYVRKLLAIKHDDRLLCARVFSLAVEKFPDHPRAVERAGIVGAEGFPYTIEHPDELSEDQDAWLKRVLAIPLPRGTLAIPGVPNRPADAKRFLGLEPPGLLEKAVDGRPIWSILEGPTSADDIRALDLSDDERLDLAGVSIIEPYWIEPVSADDLAALLSDTDAETGAAWATRFLAMLDGLDAEDRVWEQRKNPPQANVALLALNAAGEPVPAEAIAFDDTDSRVGEVLATLPDAARSAALLAHIEDPDRADFQEAAVLMSVVPHLPSDASLVNAVLTCASAVLTQVHHSDEVKVALKSAYSWAGGVDYDAVDGWRGKLSGEESKRLDEALFFTPEE